jgi:hypothetical protein
MVINAGDGFSIAHEHGSDRAGFSLGEQCQPYAASIAIRRVGSTAMVLLSGCGHKSDRCHHEQTPKRVKCPAVRLGRVGCPQTPGVRRQKKLALMVVETAENRPQPRPFDPVERRMIAFQYLQILGFPDIEIPGAVRQKRVVPAGIRNPSTWMISYKVPSQVTQPMDGVNTSLLASMQLSKMVPGSF